MQYKRLPGPGWRFDGAVMRFKRTFTITLTAIVSILVFLSGYITALGGQELALPEVGLSLLANAQWTAIQASNSLLMGVSLPQVYLPLLFR
jgi:hypothetical protein